MSIGEQIVAQFREPHGVWGDVAGWIMAHRPSNRSRNRWTVELLRLDPGDCVLELGCGPGIGLEACAGALLHGKVVGLDHSPTMLAQARRRNAAAIRAGRVELRQGSIEDLVGLEGVFDKIFSVNLVQFLPDSRAAFARLFALTRGGGLVATTYQPRHRHASRADALNMGEAVRSAKQAAGFVELRVAELALEPVPAICVVGCRPDA